MSERQRMSFFGRRTSASEQPAMGRGGAAPEGELK